MSKIGIIFKWLFALVAFVVSIIGLVGILNLGLRTYVFTKADQNCYVQPMAAPAPAAKGIDIDQKIVCDANQTSQRQRDAALDLAMIIVGVPIAVFFYRSVRKL